MRLDGGLAQCARGGHPRGASAGAEHRQQRGDHTTADRGGDGQHVDMDDEVGRGDPVVHEPFAQPAAEDRSRDDPCGGAEETDENGLPRDHAADLAGRGGDRTQQRDLPLALLNGKAERAGHDEHGDEQRDPSERRRDRDQLGARLLQFGVLGVAAGVAGEDRGVVARGTKARGVKAGRSEDADGVGLPRMAGQTRSLGVGEEHRTLLGDGVAWMCDAHDRDRAALSV